MPNDVTPEDGAPWLAQNSDALMEELLRSTAAANERVRMQLEKLKTQPDSISIADMFEMQMTTMNKLSQLSEMSTGVVSAANSAVASMARNVKG